MTDINYEDCTIQIQYFHKAANKVINGLLKYHPDGDFTGLCDLASNMFIVEFNRIIREEFSDEFFEKFIDVTYLGTVHGELAHTNNIKSKFWSYQHTIVLFEIRFSQNSIKKVYVDLTSKQFKDKVPGIPDYYIGFEPPYYMLLDKNNQCFKPFGMWLDHNFYIPWKGRKVPFMEFICYDIIGAISDKIGDIKSKNK